MPDEKQRRPEQDESKIETPDIEQRGDVAGVQADIEQIKAHNRSVDDDIQEAAEFGLQALSRDGWTTPLLTEVAGSTSISITGRDPSAAETDCNTDTDKPWIRYRKSTMAFSEADEGPMVPCDPDYIYFRKSEWYGREIVIQSY